ACSSKKESTKEQTHSMRVGEVSHSLFYDQLYVGIEKGFCKEEGLNIDLQTTAGGDRTRTTLLYGGIDIALVGCETSIYGHQQGARGPVIN
ncbi:ABC transporter substrate-binding protein, partial [Bacillus cereus]|uniref:ABC transporter substrate-binding protein n=1 Tax=Bacillus cereus TaxID=1396 RepID=UPI002842ED9B